MALVPWKDKSSAGGETLGERLNVTDFKTQMDRLFDSFVREPFAELSEGLANMWNWSPSLDVAQDEKEITVRAEIPGVEPSEVQITVEGTQLVIAGEKKSTSERSCKDFTQMESRYGMFRRSVQLPAEVEADRIQAACANGVLTVTLPKKLGPTPRKIEIKVQP